MTFRETTLASGVRARICRISFSGELAYEINIPAWYGLNTWEAVAAAGAEYNITPYGTETMHVLRAEKGYPIVGQDTDGTVTPQDAGMEWIVSKAKDFIGKRSYARADSSREDRKHLVSVLPVDAPAARRHPAGGKGPLHQPGVRSGTDGRFRHLQLPQRSLGQVLRPGPDQERPQPHRRNAGGRRRRPAGGRGCCRNSAF
jgi:glycine cleavage system aminomethyltransferase T